MGRHYMHAPVAEPDPEPVAVAEPELSYPREIMPGVRECQCKAHGTRYLEMAHPEWGWQYPIGGGCPDCSLEDRLAPRVAEELSAQEIEIGKRVQERIAGREDEIQQSVEALLAEEVPARRAELTEWFRGEVADEARTMITSEMHSEILARLVAEAKQQEKGN